MLLEEFFLPVQTQKVWRSCIDLSFLALKEGYSHVRYYLLGQLDSNQMLDSIVIKKETIMEIYNKASEHFLKLTGTSMINLIVALVSLSSFDSNHKYCSKGTE